MADETTFAGRLTSVVEAHSRSRAAFAEVLGIGDSTLKSYMQGVTEPRVTELIQICDLAQVRLEWLMLGIGPRRISEMTSDDERSKFCVVKDHVDLQIVYEVVRSVEKAFIDKALNPSPAKRADLIKAICRLSARDGKVEPEVVQLMLQFAE